MRKWMAMQDKFVEHDAQREQIGVCAPSGGSHIRRPVPPRSGSAPGLAGLGSNVKINQLGLMRWQLKHDVRWLDVAMIDAVFVQCLQRIEQLEPDAYGVGPGQPSFISTVGFK